MKCDAKRGDREAFEQRAAAGGNAPAANRAARGIELRLVGGESHRGCQVRNGPALVSEQQRDGAVVDGCGPNHARIFVGAVDANRDYGSAGREEVRRNAVQYTQIQIAVDVQVLFAAGAARDCPVEHDVRAWSGEARRLEIDLVRIESDFQRRRGTELDVFNAESELREFGRTR